MIRINLIPFRAARKKENIRRQISVFFLSLVLLLLILGMVQWYLGSIVKEKRSKIEATRKELANYQKINQEITEIKKKLQSLEKKLEVIETLQVNRKEPVRMMELLASVVIRERMWLTKTIDQDTTINLDGIALDNQTVADFMTRLEDTDYFSAVNLRIIDTKKILNKDNLKSFNINCTKDLNRNKNKDDQKAKR